MQFKKNVFAVDSHTMGEPTRVIVGGVPNIPGLTMPEKKSYLENHMDYLRTALMHEPRGHNDMFGSILTAPSSSEADFGIIFMDGGGYLNMCGHGTIGACTVAVETGMVEMNEPVTKVVLEAPAGLVRAEVQVREKKVKEVSFVNVPAFLYKRDVEVFMPSLGKNVKLDISFGGSFFGIINAAEFGLSVEVDKAQELKRLALELRDILNCELEVVHPLLPHIKTVDLIEIFDRPSNPEANYKNLVVFGQGQLDRSPCGTGTSAKMATLYAKDELKIGEKFVYESIIGTLFKGRVLAETSVGSFKAVIPEITGSAYITGLNQYVIDDDDPIGLGFVI
ncbi:proline racemase [Dethiosulfovibrio sp. F2B]|uniref:proline racemase n=1 Tax=Dethiosulfovibrio faecalis TaxID=2720018 RepID=UPI001F48348B|nr:proline racemase [Dethiosulfovibrio faecalis]MCF4151533.1 proline racemase [Dethiosulfovibrio faecalis]